MRDVYRPRHPSLRQGQLPLVIALALAGWLIPALSAAQCRPYYGYVSIDGRIAITPETGQQTYSIANIYFSNTQTGGMAAAARAWLNGRQAILWPTRRYPDRYGQCIAQVFDESGESLAAYLLNQGLAWYWPQTGHNQATLYQAEATGRTRRRGIWHRQQIHTPATASEATPADFILITGQPHRIKRYTQISFIDFSNRFSIRYLGRLPETLQPDSPITARGLVGVTDRGEKYLESCPLCVTGALK